MTPAVQILTKCIVLKRMKQKYAWKPFTAQHCIPGAMESYSVLFLAIPQAISIRSLPFAWQEAYDSLPRVGGRARASRGLPQYLQQYAHSSKGLPEILQTQAISKSLSESYCIEGPTWACRSVVQFAYGEDGLDVTKKSFMREFGFLARNAQRFAQQVDLAGAQLSSSISGLKPVEAAVQKRNR